MPLPRWVAKVNRRFTNHLARPLATHAPGFGVVVHSGRKSHRVYRTPVNVFGTPDGYVIALTYGADSDWVRNVLAAGECGLEVRGRVEHVAVGAVVHDESAARVPRPVALVLRMLHVADFLKLTRAPAASR
jgi:deazaflavin-dependent oxidoreductase (nitroreductase family)